MRLADFQQQFQAAILDPKTKVTDADLGMKIREGSKPQFKLSVHHHHFWSRMKTFLRSRHLLLAKYLSDEEFNEVVKSYIVKYPPISVIMSDVPAKLGEFLGTEKPWSESPVLTHLAHYDWHRAIAAAGAEEATIQTADLAGMSFGDLADVVIRMKKRAIVVETKYRFHQLDRAKLDRNTPPDPKSTFLLVKMNGKKFDVREIDERIFKALRLLEPGISVSDLFKELGALGFSDTQCRACFAAWIGADLIVGVEEE